MTADGFDGEERKKRDADKKLKTFRWDTKAFIRAKTFQKKRRNRRWRNSGEALVKIIT